MDVHDIFDQKLKKLPSGSHSDGLRAVKLHIDAAVRHFIRAQAENDEPLYTDAIYRCNQAFEGSTKEAYRVLASKDPQKKTPADIEKFLASSNLLRKKVLDQFTNYRREWRNPSTHDYTLDFDEDEALLAIVSVTVFAIVLCDQIESKIAFNAAAAATPATNLIVSHEEPILDLVANVVMAFGANHVDSKEMSLSPVKNYYRLEGELAGYLSSALSSVNGLEVVQNQKISEREADIVVKRGSEFVVVELKNASMSGNINVIMQRATAQAASYVREPGVVGAIAFLYSHTNKEYAIKSAAGNLADVVRIVAPQWNGIQSA